jgi:hypothetical protein
MRQSPWARWLLAFLDEQQTPEHLPRFLWSFGYAHAPLPQACVIAHIFAPHVPTFIEDLWDSPRRAKRAGHVQVTIGRRNILTAPRSNRYVSCTVGQSRRRVTGSAQGVTTMRIAMALTAAVFALATSTHLASAQISGGGGGTIGCDPGAPTFGVQATNCRIFFQESLYGPAANPYAAPWGPGYAAAPVVRHRTVIRRDKARSVRKSGVSDATR